MAVNPRNKLIAVILVSLLTVFMIGAVCFVSWQQSLPKTPTPTPAPTPTYSFPQTSSSSSESQTSSATETSSSESSQSTVSEPEPAPTVQEIQLTTYQLDLEVGESQMPIVTMLPEQAPDKGEIWTTSNASVANVTNMGLVSGISPGTCTITVTSSANPAVSATVAVTVRAAPEPPQVETQPEETAVSTETSSTETSSGSGLTFRVRSYYWDYAYDVNEQGNYVLYWDDGRVEELSPEEWEALEEEGRQQAYTPTPFY